MSPGGAFPVVSAGMSACLDAVDAALDALSGESFDGCDDAGVLDVLRRFERSRDRLPAVLDHRGVAEIECRSLPATLLRRDSAAVLQATLRLDRGHAVARVRAATRLGTRRSVTGEPLDPEHPATAAAQAEGSLSVRHTEVIARAVHGLPRTLDDEVRAKAEQTLAEEAVHLDPTELVSVARHLAAHLDPDGSLPDDADRAQRRHLSIGAQHPDGMTPVRGLLDATTRALVEAAFAALARPTTEDDVTDPRSVGQRNHDALAALCTAALAAGGLPQNRGLPATVLLTMTITQLEAAIADVTAAAPPSDASSSTEDSANTPPGPGAFRRHTARNPDGATVSTATGTRMGVSEALTLATNARWVLSLVDHDGQPLFLGRSRRLASTAQRLALNVRDRGCTRPGCSMPAAFTEVHHLDPWTAPKGGGRTELTNLALVCSFDHHLITDGGYVVTLNDRGRVEWTAPRQIDLGRTPRVNAMHHRPEISDPDPP